MGNEHRYTLYLHHKGGIYRILFSASNATNAHAQEHRPLDLIVYISLATGKILVREANEFFGEIEPGVRRFVPFVADEGLNDG